jgi:hypothetical protein
MMVDRVIPLGERCGRSLYDVRAVHELVVAAGAGM